MGSTCIEYAEVRRLNQYFEHRFKTNAMGAISVDPEHPPGAKRLYEIRKRIVASKVHCVFREPQFEPKLAHSVTEGTSAKIETLDPSRRRVVAGTRRVLSIASGYRQLDQPLR